MTAPHALPPAREMRDAVLPALLPDYADQLIAEAGGCGELRAGRWLFLARTSEAWPGPGRNTDHRLWTGQADIHPQARLTPRVTPWPTSVRIYSTDAGALNVLRTARGLAGIAIFLDRSHRRNDGVIEALTWMLEPRLPDDDGPVPWYGTPHRLHAEILT